MILQRRRARIVCNLAHVSSKDISENGKVICHYVKGGGIFIVNG